MRTILLVTLMLFGTSAYAAQIEFSFVALHPFCQCYFIETENGEEMVWDLVGQEEPDVSVDLINDSSYGSDTNGTFYGGSFLYNTDSGVFSDIDLAARGSQGGFAMFTSATYGSTSTLTSAFRYNPQGYSVSNTLTLDFLTSLDSVADGTLVEVQANLDWVCSPYSSECTIEGSGTTAPGTLYMLASVTAVPIPAAVWLFGSGLGLLGWFRRRQSA